MLTWVVRRGEKSGAEEAPVVFVVETHRRALPIHEHGRETGRKVEGHLDESGGGGSE